MNDTTSLPASDTATTVAPENPYAAPQPTVVSTPAATGTPGFSIAALVLGIAAIPTGWGIASIAAIVLGFIARSREPQGRTMANWGLALGFVGAFGWILVAILGLAFIAPFALWGAAFAWVPGL